jgi:FixJ family two-component response regulator
MQPQKTIAIVDDDPDMQKAIGRLLRASGFQSETFFSAETFLDRDRRRKADCLVLDIQLGGISAIDLCHRLTAAGCRLPVIFITALDDELIHQTALDAGCVAYLRKPFPAHLLIGAIEKAVG